MIQLICVLSVTLGGQENLQTLQYGETVSNFCCKSRKICRVLSLQPVVDLLCLHKPPYSLLPIYFLVSRATKTNTYLGIFCGMFKLTYFPSFFLPSFLPSFLPFLYHIVSFHVSILVIPSIILMYFFTLNSFANSKQLSRGQCKCERTSTNLTLCNLSFIHLCKKICPILLLSLQGEPGTH